MRNPVRVDAAFWLLAIFAVIYIAGNIGTGSLATWDEAVYANISRNLLDTGNWLILHQGKAPWFDKPPLYMWCTAFFYLILGVSEFSVRITSSIFGVGTIILAYIFAKRIVDNSMALVAALLLLAAPHYLHYSKMGMMDVMLTFFISLMVYLFWVGQEKPSYLFWSGAALLFAYFTKGMAAITGIAIIFLYCVFSGNLRLLVKRQFLYGILFSLVAILAWHIGQYLVAGSDAVKNYFGFHIFKRATTVVEGHTGGINFYQKVLFNKNKPWAVLFYASSAYMLWLALKDKDKRAILMVSWIAAVYIICTVVKTKLNWYVMPIYPALAISSAIFLSSFLKGRFYNLILAVILLGMLIQVPASWAFKLDFNAKAKEAALNSMELPYEDDGTIFYFKTIKAR